MILIENNTIMRNQIFKWFGLVIIAGLGFVIMRCENSYTVTQPVDELTLTARSDDALETNNSTAEDFEEFCNFLLREVKTQELSEEEIKALLFMREEEKLARDIYLTLKETWKMPIFANISGAEQRHMDAVLCLINRYPDELSDPVGDREIGDFAEPEIQALFTEFSNNLPLSLIEALKIGATIEDRDIKDLMDALDDEDIDNTDIKMVFGALLRGSHNHLRAFITLLDNMGTTYVPKFLSKDEFNDILEMDWERGGLTCLTCPECQGSCDGTCPGCNGVCPVCDGVCKAECPYGGSGPYGDGTCDGICTNDACPQFLNEYGIGKCGQIVAAYNRNKIKIKNRKMNSYNNKNRKKGKK